MKSINLALQGGGSHGAFTWGVLDRLLESDAIHIEGISGSSAGAMNAAVVADGMMDHGPAGAREHLENFWSEISRFGQASPLHRTIFDVIAGNWNLDNSPGYIAFDLLTRLASPYELNPLDLNPLKELVIKTIDFDRLRRCNRLRLFISATVVRTGKVKVFEHHELSPDAIMASACLPQLFKAVEIDGESYWDGGYMGNPALFPFFYKTATRDIVIVRINPLSCQSTPTKAMEIVNRVNEINFNSSLLSELRAVDFVGRLIEEGRLEPGRYKQMLVHIIDGEQPLAPLNASSKFNTEWAFLRKLFDIGRTAADDWLEQNYDNLGKRSSVNVREILR